MQQGRGAFFPIKRSHHTTKQRGSPKRSPHNKTCHVISSRSSVGGFIYHVHGGGVHRDHFGINGTQTAPTPLQTDNSMAEAVINGKIQTKRTKAMNMRFRWLRDRECQEQFRIYWRPGKYNCADYWTKHHPSKHHRNTRKEFLTPYIVLEILRIEQQNSTTKATQTNSHKKEALARV